MRHRAVRKVETLAALAAVLAGASALAASYFLEIKGPYVDLVASEFATRRLGAPVTMLDVRVRRWSDIRFGLATVSTNDARTLVACGSGRIVLAGLALVKGDFTRARVALRDVALLEDLYRRWSMTSWAAGRAFDDPIFVKRLEATLLVKDEYSEAHLRRFDSDEMVLAGGVRWKGRAFKKANVFVLLPEARFERVPKELRGRMIRRREGWRGFRVTFGAGRLTVYGHSGPFFTAQWAVSGSP